MTNLLTLRLFLKSVRWQYVDFRRAFRFQRLMGFLVLVCFVFNGVHLPVPVPAVERTFATGESEPVADNVVSESLVSLEAVGGCHCSPEKRSSGSCCCSRSSGGGCCAQRKHASGKKEGSKPKSDATHVAVWLSCGCGSHSGSVLLIGGEPRIAASGVCVMQSPECSELLPRYSLLYEEAVLLPESPPPQLVVC